jgi:hypothetical protein
MSGLKNMWMSFVKQQSEKTAMNPHARAKMIGWIVVMLIMGNCIPKTQAGSCASCFEWALSFCGKAVSAGGTSYVLLSPFISAGILTLGGIACTAAAGTCAVGCF